MITNSHISALRECCPLFFSYDHQNYARFLTLYYLQMLNLEVNYPGAQTYFVKNGFSVAGSTYRSPPQENLLINQSSRRTTDQLKLPVE